MAFAALAAALAVLFVRLGFWQLDRRLERRASNEWTRQQLARSAVPYADLVREPAVSLDSAGPSVDSARAPQNRHATVSGTPDYENEFVVTGRSRNGSPGVHIITPVRVDGEDRAVLVNRGWVYAADAATIDARRWREERRSFSGYTQQIPLGHTVSAVRGRGLRPLLHNGVERLLPYAFHGLYLVSRDSSSEATPVRLPEPDLNEGPHLSYAIQWFCFAAIALVGGAIVLYRASGARGAGSTAA